MRVLERNIFQGELAGRGEEDSYYLCLRESKESAVRARLEGITEDINSFNKKREADTAYCLAFRQGAYVVEEPQMDDYDHPGVVPRQPVFGSRITRWENVYFMTTDSCRACVRSMN